MPDWTHIQVLGDEASTPSQIDRECTNLARQLRLHRLDVRNVDKPAPAGTKSGMAMAVGELVVAGALEAHLVASVRDILVGMIRRTGRLRIRLTKGDKTLDLDASELDSAELLSAVATFFQDEEPRHG